MHFHSSTNYMNYRNSNNLTNWERFSPSTAVFQEPLTETYSRTTNCRKTQVHSNRIFTTHVRIDCSIRKKESINAKGFMNRGMGPTWCSNNTLMGTTISSTCFEQTTHDHGWVYFPGEKIYLELQYWLVRISVTSTNVRIIQVWEHFPRSLEYPHSVRVKI